MVFGICRLMLRDPDEAEDAAQQVFLSAYRSLLAGTEPRNPGAWLGTIARNEARNRIATRPLRPLGLERDRERASVTLEEQAGARADLAELRDELSVLPEKQREAVVLRDLYGLRYDEVARALGISRPAVEALLFRGRRRLQRRLRPEIAAGVLVVPLALRESLAYALPGFAAGGASTAGVLAKLSAVPIAAKLAAAGASVSVVGSAGVIAERELEEPSRRPAATLVEQVVRQQPALVLPSVALPEAAATQAEVDDLDEPEDIEEEQREDVEEAEDGDRLLPLVRDEDEDEPEHEDDGADEREGADDTEEADDTDEEPDADLEDS